MGVELGIDFGTTHTVAAVFRNGRPQVIPNAEGQRLTPSVVAFSKDGQPLVGHLAKRQAATNPERTFFSIKRWMGSGHRVRVGAKEYLPQEIASLILSKAKVDVEDHLGQRVEQAVITVPAYFNDRQRQATREAGSLAGLDVTRIINEPTASALAYGLQREDVHTVLVWDLGGGTFDVSILELGHGVFEVRAVSGDSWLGGDDYDRRLMDYLAGQCDAECGTEICVHQAKTWQRLREVAQKAKIELSSAPFTRVHLRLGDNGGDGRRELELTLTRETFQELTGDLVHRMVGPTCQALADAGLEPGDIDRVILVGGATRMPAVRDLARKLFGKEPYRYIDPDEAVALGAAIHAGMLHGSVGKAVLLDVIPLSLGIETQGGLFARIIPRNTPLPISEAMVFTTAADGQTSVDVHVLQGERELALYNISLGTFQLSSIPPLPRGMPKIEVAFNVDVDGIVHVSVTDLLSENKESLKLASAKALHADEVEHLVSEARASADEDATEGDRRRTSIEAANLIAAAEKVLQEVGSPGLRNRAEEISKGIVCAQEALAGDSILVVRRRSEELRQLLRDLEPVLR